MQGREKMKYSLRSCFYFLVTAFLLVGLLVNPSTAQQSSSGSPANSPLVKILQSKGILTDAEANLISQAGSPAEAEQRLAKLLLAKGLISQSDYEQTVGTSVVATTASASSEARMIPAVLRIPGNDRTAAPNAPGSFAWMLPGRTNGTTDIAFGTIETGSRNPEPAAPPAVIPAFAPIRVLPVGLIGRESVKSVIGMGPVRIQPYGFFKMNVIEDSSNPFGGDAVLTGMLVTNTGPNANPQFHLNARASRFGANFEWLDSNPKLVVTGKLEFDFEGNFTSVFNRGISSVRSSMPGIRLAFGRLDYHATEQFGVFGEFGQNWTIFCSSTLPSSNETTLLGVGFGSCYERDMQVRFGFNYDFGGSRHFQIQPEAAIAYPALGNSTAASQASIGERTGADANQPQWQTRVALQFQLDKAPGVAPAQFIVSGMLGEGKLLVANTAVPAAFTAAFPGGASTTFRTAGYSAEAQLPTRWFTLQGKYWGGEAMRFFFVDNLLSAFNPTAAFLAANPTGSFATAASLSGEGAPVAFGCAVPLVAGSCPVASASVLPQLPIRGVGGFADLGIPLSRLAHANPSGRNAGWTLNFHYAVDQSRARDLRSNSAVFSPITKLTSWSGVRGKNDWAAATLNYKINAWVLIGFEEGYYRTRALPASCAPVCSASNPFGSPLVTNGLGVRSWHDLHTQISTIFFF
jgi:hypothetical protein